MATIPFVADFDDVVLTFDYSAWLLDIYKPVVEGAFLFDGVAFPTTNLEAWQEYDQYRGGSGAGPTYLEPPQFSKWYDGYTATDIVTGKDNWTVSVTVITSGVIEAVFGNNAPAAESGFYLRATPAHVGGDSFTWSYDTNHPTICLGSPVTAINPRYC